jgi:hypothetical protein
VRAVRLALRGLRWRRGQSLVLLAVAVTATASAALGPIWSRSAEASLLTERLRAAPVADSALVRTGIASLGLAPQRLDQAVEATALSDEEERWFGRRYLAARIPDGTVRVHGLEIALAGVGWYQEGCSAVRTVAGRCVQADGEAMLPVRARSLGVRLGDTVGLQISDLGPDTPARVVGFYDRPQTASPVWARSNPFDGGVSPVGGLSRLDTVFVSKGTIETANDTEYRSYALRPLLVDRVRLADVGALDDFAARARLVDDQQGITTDNQLPPILQAIAEDRAVARSTTRAVTFQLVLLAEFVLFLVVAATTEERGREVALVKLRGMRPLQTSAFGLAEPLLLLLAGLPFGVLLAYWTDRAVAKQVLLPGTPVGLSGEVWLSVALALLGGVLACALALRRVLVAPVASQLARTGGSRASLRRAGAVDAVVVTCALAGAYELTRGQSDTLTLLTPGLLALAAGLLVVRALPWLARGLVRRTRRSTHVAPFLAWRQVARRAAVLRVVVLLAVASSLAVFTVDAFAVAARNRVERAHVETGADRVLHVAQSTPDRLQAAVAAADPTGRLAMAAMSSGSASNPTGEMVAVDVTRLAAVSDWRRSWWSRSPADLVRTLRPAGAAPVVVHDRVAVGVRAGGLSVTAPVHVELDLRDGGGARYREDLGVAHEGAQTLRAALPQCRGGCRLATVHLQNQDSPEAPIGTVVLTSMTDSRGAVDAGLADPARWRPAPGSRRDFEVTPAAQITPDRTGLHIDLGGFPGDDIAVEVTDHPAVLPALLGPAVDPARMSPPREVVSGVGLDGATLRMRPAGAASVLPRAGVRGSLVDLQSVDRTDAGPPIGADYQVWLSAAAGPEVLRRLRQAGVVVRTVDSRAVRQAQLDHDGLSLSLRLFLVATLAAVVLAVGAVASAVYAGARRREYELAAIRTLGGTRRTLVSAARTEQLALLGTGLVVGTVASLVAAAWALPHIPPVGTGPSGVPASFRPAWASVGLLVAGVVVLAVLCADLLARAVVRASVPDRLREGAP